MQKELLIIIPAYNEAKNIGKILSDLEQPEIAAIANVLVINDASSDDTNWIVKDTNHALVTHVFNLGYGSALQLGYKYAIRCNYKYVIQMDADGQHDVCNIPLIYSRLTADGANQNAPDIVLGSRYLQDSGAYATPPLKELAYKLFRSMIRRATGEKIMDPTSGLQGLSRRTVLYYSRYQQFEDKYPDANMVMQMILLGFRVEEVPAIMHQRTEGVSMHAGWKPILYMFRMLLSIWVIFFRIRVLKMNVGEENRVLEMREKR